ncbi:hypothetical protein [Allosalinactinospora lopnorensis]|uniref:hypothetical protein n=1 Tax=Allosalinactinospora lopnorensis TaxID=1352348 RepID=UPI003084348E
MAPDVRTPPAGGSAAARRPRGRRRAPRSALNSRGGSVIGALLVSVLAASLFVEGFATGRNGGFLILDVAAVALIALPMTLIVITGEIDLSVASTLGLTSAAMGQLWVMGVPLETIVRCACCWARRWARSTGCW